MPAKPNYNFQRAERDRAKKAAKEAKLAERKLAAARKSAGEATEDAEGCGADEGDAA